ncbi:MAG: DUF4249 domain-containing protein [Bacteroidales bacterium]|nr:DUF4249 domain-containing protein [Bacteroidales bacterium]
MKNYLHQLIILFVLLLSGCVTDFDMELKDAEPRLVVDGLITSNPGPYYVRLIKSNVAIFNSTDTGIPFTDNAEAVLDALIIISDDRGQIDTLGPLDNSNIRYLTYEQGYYQTNKIQGIPGHTYYLNIRIKDKVYSAECYMPTVPLIDSVDYIIEKGEIGKSDNYIPRLYFEEPQNEENFYLINYYKVGYHESENLSYLDFIVHYDFWHNFILSDKYLDPNVKALRVENGSSPNDQGYYWIFPGDEINIRLMSLTAGTYDYYKILLEQFEYDGGTYKPAPASPLTNVSNGALGFFRASAVSQKKIKIPEN